MNNNTKNNGSNDDKNKDQDKRPNSVESVRSSETVTKFKSITDEDTSQSESNQEEARREAEKREKLTQNKADTYHTENKSKTRKSRDVIFETITRELPKDMASFLIWLNIITGVLSFILMSITWAQYLQHDDEETVGIVLVTLSMCFSIGGQFLSWFGTSRSNSGYLIFSIVLLSMAALFSFAFIVLYFIECERH